MPLPFFCAVCDKPIVPCKHRKYSTVHDNCMMEYLDEFDSTSSDEFNKNITTTFLPKKPKK